MKTDVSIPSLASPVAGSSSQVACDKQAVKTVVASLLGGILEYYDFFIYGSAAAIIFSRTFFAIGDESAQLSAFATFGVAYIARPLGALVLGGLGDKFGRKRVLIWTISIMGVSTFCVGCIPNFTQIGFAAPILLVACRLLQGISAGGELAGASTMIIEHTRSDRRGLYGSWVQSGSYLGFVLASLAFLAVSTLREDALLSWGWRIPFWLSAVVMAIAFMMRRTLVEPPVFEAVAEETRAQKRLPVTELLSENLGALIRVAGLTVQQAIFSMVMVYSLSFATSVAGVNRTFMFTSLLFMAAAGAVFAPLGGYLSDKIGRRPVFVLSCAGCALLAFPFGSAIAHHQQFGIFVWGVALIGVVYALGVGVTPAFFAEQFKTKIRYSGMAIGLQIGQLAGGFLPALTTAAIGKKLENWPTFSWIIVGLACVAAFAAVCSPETNRVDLRKLGEAAARDAE